MLVGRGLKGRGDRSEARRAQPGVVSICVAGRDRLRSMRRSASESRTHDSTGTNSLDTLIRIIIRRSRCVTINCLYC